MGGSGGKAGDEAGNPDRPPSGSGGSGRLHEDGAGSDRPQGEDGSGLETGGNSDSGGPEDEPTGGNASAGGTGIPDGDGGPARPAGADEKDSAGRPRGANGLLALGLKPHASQN